LDVGFQPISNRFLKSQTQTEEVFEIGLRQCDVCGLLQIEKPVPARALVPPFDWITYDEPEGHLDRLADILAALPGIGPGSVAAGISFKDDSLLGRLERKGLRTWRLDLEKDLGVTDAAPGFGVETVQDRLTAAAAGRVLERRQTADIVIARHILEHSGRPMDFIAALKRLTASDGYTVFEVPDCSRSIAGCDYTMIWEEHVLYFTPATFAQVLRDAGLDVVRAENYPYPFENSLVAITKVSRAAGNGRPTRSAAALERTLGTAFGEKYSGYREKVRRFLAGRRERGRIALFGAGHLACTWIALMGVEDLIDFVVDDNPNKRGLYMPGSKLPIVGSEALANPNVTLCLLSLNPIGEEKVIAKHSAFVERGGAFASIFPASERGLHL
jgi:hypothetical protein